MHLKPSIQACPVPVAGCVPQALEQNDWSGLHMICPLNLTIVQSFTDGARLLLTEGLQKVEPACNFKCSAYQTTVWQCKIALMLRT